MINQSNFNVNDTIVVNYISRGVVVVLNNNQLVVPLVGEGLVTNGITNVYASYKGDYLGGDQTKILIRLGDNRVVAILQSAIISARKI